MQAEYYKHSGADAIIEGSLQLVKPERTEISLVVARAAALVTEHMLPSLLTAQSSYDQAINQTLQDKMTGLDNPRGFSMSLRKAAAFALQHGLPYTVACMYLTNLKYVNDTHGYSAGDDLLVTAAQCLTDSSGMNNPKQQAGCELRQAARLENGDEFGVILVGAEEPEALAWWQTMDETFRSSNVEMCLGLSTSSAHNPEEPTIIYDSAYDALQQARLKSQAVVIH